MECLGTVRRTSQISRYLLSLKSTDTPFQTDSVQQAFALDALRTSHPIEVPVYDGLEVDQIFDHISYLKGSSVIRMLSAHLGEKDFLQGVADYLKAHQYSNATTKRSLVSSQQGVWSGC